MAKSAWLMCATSPPLRLLRSPKESCGQKIRRHWRRIFIKSNYRRNFSDALGHEIKYVDVPEDQARKQMLNAKMPIWMVDAVMELNQIGKAGDVAATRPAVEDVTERAPLTFRQFAGENKQSFA